MSKDIKHVHGNIKIKLAKFLSKQFKIVYSLIAGKERSLKIYKII